MQDHGGRAALAGRLVAWQQKALREAKLATDWMAPNERYEAAAQNFLMRLLASELIVDIAAFAHRIAPAGAVNGLAQTLVKLTAPGVPDTYQGTEFWDLSLVDPDNRRPVDFELRMQTLKSAMTIVDLVRSWRDGQVKQAIIRDALKVRRAHPELFSAGDYLPLESRGPASDHLLGFARSHRGAATVTVVCRLVAPLLAADGGLTIPVAAWSGTTLHLPEGLASATFENVLVPAEFAPQDGCLPIAKIFGALPVALLAARA